MVLVVHQVQPVPQGIQGERGLTGNGTHGPQGIQGPPGPSIINSSNLYFVIGNDNMTSTGEAISRATCDPGDTIFFGSYSIQNLGIVDSVSSFPFDRVDFDVWETIIRELVGNYFTVKL